MFSKQLLLSSQQPNKIPWQQITVAIAELDGDESGVKITYNVPILYGKYMFTRWEWGINYDNEYFCPLVNTDTTLYVLSKQAMVARGMTDIEHFPDTADTDACYYANESTCTVQSRISLGYNDNDLYGKTGYYFWFDRMAFTDGKFPKVGDIHDIYITTERPYWMSSY